MGVPISRCLLLLVDGLRPDVAEARLAAGELPHLEAMLEAGGRTRAITVFPSTTSVAYLPFLTGCTPGHCNIPSIRWLDRQAYGGRWWREREAVRSYCGYQAPRLDDDIAPDVRTIFELVPESIGIFTPVARGLTAERDPSRRERQFWGALAHYAQWHQPSDDAVARHLLRAVDGPARFVFAQFPAVDGYSHQTDPDAEPVRRALRKVDAVVGRVRARLEARGELESTLILVVSDHGAASVHTHLDLADWFRAQGVPTLSHPVLWERAPRAAVMVAGNGSAMVYARPGEPRAARWPIERLRRPETFGVEGDLVAALLREPAVGLVAAETADGGVWVSSAEGAARLRVTGTGDTITAMAYEPLTGDPLKCGGRATGLGARLARGELGRRLSRRRLSPARPVSRRAHRRPAGDRPRRLRLPAAVRSAGAPLGHGSLARSHMQTPVWSSEPLPAEPIRTVDLFPAMLDWLGVAVPEGIDGEAIWRPGELERRGAKALASEGAGSES